MCRRKLLVAGVKPETIQEDRIEYEYFNLLQRVIEPQPRRVIFSKEFHCPTDYETALQNFVAKSLRGESLQGYTSTTILDAGYNDLLLEDWNLYHFHLNNRFNDTGFAKRSQYIMLGWVTSDAVYLIQVYNHSDELKFCRKEIIHVIHENWPELLENAKVQGGISLAQQINDIEYKALREKHVSTMLDLGKGDVFWSPGGGYTSDGSSLNALRKSDFWSSRIRQEQQLILANIYSLVKYFDENGIADIKLLLLGASGTVGKDEVYTFFEKNSEKIVQHYVDEGYFRICSKQEIFEK